MDPSMNSSTAANDAASKRQAMTGQWRTPPLPVFGSHPQQLQQQQQQQLQQHQHQQRQQQQQQLPPIQPQPPANITLPESTDDYAAALQEAYRRGAEAAAAMQQQQMPNAVSCPNFHQLPVAAAPPPVQEPVMLVPNPLASMPPLPPSEAGRSFSLPDMASYAARAQVEEEKRKKRLARNRASARLRRLRKKNLVDSYEGEVGVLELSLQKLKAHEWGAGHSHDALLEALGMERGQQNLGFDERRALIQEILQQQRAQLAVLKEVQMEQVVLKELLQGEWPELDSLLNLTPEQKESLARATSGLDEEVQAMETLEASLEVSLENAGMEALTSQFMGIFHPNQISKFLLWTDANAEVIDQLDYCHAGPPATAPMFSFGMDDYGASQLSLNTMDEE